MQTKKVSILTNVNEDLKRRILKSENIRHQPLVVDLDKEENTNDRLKILSEKVRIV